MAPQRGQVGNNGGDGEGSGNGATTRGRGTRRRTARRTGAAPGMRRGVATGGTSGGQSLNVNALTPEQRKFYNLGARHTCEMHGINWSGGTIAGR